MPSNGSPPCSPEPRALQAPNAIKRSHESGYAARPLVNSGVNCRRAIARVGPRQGRAWEVPTRAPGHASENEMPRPLWRAMTTVERVRWKVYLALRHDFFRQEQHICSPATSACDFSPMLARIGWHYWGVRLCRASGNRYGRASFVITCSARARTVGPKCVQTIRVARARTGRRWSLAPRHRPLNESTARQRRHDVAKSEPRPIYRCSTSRTSARRRHELEVTLHELVDLSLIGKQLHWAVVGPLFRPLHLHLDEMVDSWRELSIRSPCGRSRWATFLTGRRRRWRPARRSPRWCRGRLRTTR